MVRQFHSERLERPVYAMGVIMMIACLEFTTALIFFVAAVLTLINARRS